MSTHDFERIVGLVSKDTKKGSEIVAKLFYRILRKNGYHGRADYQHLSDPPRLPHKIVQGVQEEGGGNFYRGSEG